MKNLITDTMFRTQRQVAASLVPSPTRGAFSHRLDLYRSLDFVQVQLQSAVSVVVTDAFTSADLAWFRSPIGGLS